MKIRGAKAKLFIRLMQEQAYENMRFDFEGMGTGGHYTWDQKLFVFDKIKKYGVRATARILKIPRKTLQRWCRKYGISVKRCPGWVYEWAKKRQEKREFWEMRGY
jgi:hypothetical protein